jgi:hypothetical protein
MAGGEVGYRQSLLNLENAQKDLDKAIAEHGPTSDEAAAASLRLDGANVQLAGAVLGLDSDTQTLMRTLRETPEAFDAELAKLEESKKMHPEAAAAIQIQIDKLIGLKGSLDAIPPVTIPKVEVDVSGALWSIGIVRGALAGIDNARASVGGFISGERAAGGPVNAGSMYLVGEKGPELFAPSQSGRIIPNHALGGSGPANVQIYIDGSGDPAAVAREVKANLMSIGAL